MTEVHTHLVLRAAGTGEEETCHYPIVAQYNACMNFLKNRYDKSNLSK